jgi:hypothetical protein
LSWVAQIHERHRKLVRPELQRSELLQRTSNGAVQNTLEARRGANLIRGLPQLRVAKFHEPNTNEPLRKMGAWKSDPGLWTRLDTDKSPEQGTEQVAHSRVETKRVKDVYLPFAQGMATTATKYWGCSVGWVT